MGGRPSVCHLECGEYQTVIVNAEETAGHLTGGAAAIGGLFFIRISRGELSRYRSRSGVSAGGRPLAIAAAMLLAC